MAKKAQKSVDNFFRAHGRLSYSFTYIQDLMKWFVEDLLNANDMNAGKCVTANMPFSALLDSLMSLYRIKADTVENVEKLKTILNRVNAIGEKRNSLTHNTWSYNEKEGFIGILQRRAKFKTGLVEKTVPVKAEEIDFLSDELENLIINLFDLRFDWIGKHVKQPVN